MRAYSDWNCRLLPMMGDLIANPENSIRSMKLLKEKFGLSHFCMMPEFDCTQESISAFLIRRDRAAKALQAGLPKDIKITLCGAALVSTGLSTEMGLQKLRLPKSNLLPIQLPFFPSNETAKELNRLLYHLPYRILFLSFDSYLNFYSKEDINRWIDLPDVAYQLNYSALERPEVIALMKKLLQRNATIFFGTGINNYGKACYYELDHYLAIAHQNFNDYERDCLFFPKKSHITLSYF